MPCRRCLIARAVLFFLAFSSAATVGPASAEAKPRCFGAAARDAENPCTNPALARSVTPGVIQALRDPGPPCAALKRTRQPEVCDFGTPKKRARATFALIGDSHASHWRGALATVARDKRWRGLMLYHTRCPLSMARKPDSDRAKCYRWRESVFAYMAAHPELETVFVSQNSGSPVTPPPGEDETAYAMKGYADAWRALPPSVKNIFVLRDVPHNDKSGNACVRRVLRKRGRFDDVCHRPREEALGSDEAAEAARTSDDPRVHSIDLSDHMCDSRLCYQVVGGVLVIKDFGHLTRVFSETLGPYLLRAVDRILGTHPAG